MSQRNQLIVTADIFADSLVLEVISSQLGVVDGQVESTVFAVGIEDLRQKKKKCSLWLELLVFKDCRVWLLRSFFGFIGLQRQRFMRQLENMIEVQLMVFSCHRGFLLQLL